MSIDKGSMALNRMDSAKGSAISLLSEAYKSRDKICLIAFHGKQAEIIVPITKSIALTKRRLEQLPCGGGSPLAHALSTATRMGLNSIKVKKDVGRVVIVLVTDGRANTPLCVSMGESFEPSTDIASTGGMPSKSYLKDEVLALARKIGSIKDFDMLVIDTEDKFVGTGMAKALATVAFANYYHIEATNLATVSSITRDTVESFR
jgi:magnesium chelatase subunit D